MQNPHCLLCLVKTPIHVPPQSRINMICHRLLSSVLWALHLPVTDNIAWTYNTGYIGAWTFSRDSACQLGLDRFDYSIVPIPPIIQAASQTIVLNSDEKAWRGCVNRLRFCASVKKKLSSFQTVCNVTFGMNGMWLSLVDEKNGHILPTGQWYAPSAVINDALIMPEYARACQSMPKYARVCQSLPEYARVCKSMP